MQPSSDCLTPGRKIGVGQERQHERRLPHRIAERVAEQARIARENGERIVADPGIALKALTHHQATFSEHDVAKFLHTRTDGAEQFRAAYVKVTTSPDLVALGSDDRGRQRYTSREMLETERRLLERAQTMARRRAHGVNTRRQSAARSQGSLSADNRSTMTKGQDLGVLSARTWRLADLGAKHAFLRAGLGWGGMPAELVQSDLSRGTLVKIVAEDAPEGFVVAMSAVYRTAAPPGIAGRWFIDRLKQGSRTAARKRVQLRRRKHGEGK